MKTESKIIKYLIETKKEPTIRQLSQDIKSDYKIVHTAVSRLTDKGILEKKKIGKSIQLRFTPRLSKEVFEAELERREEVLKNKSLAVMLDSIKNDIITTNFVLVLFGSYSRNTQDQNSDIDLMFIVPRANMEKSIAQAISILPLNIHYFVFTERQFRKMKDSRKVNIAHEAIKSNVLLYGIEQYYEMLK